MRSTCSLASTTKPTTAGAASSTSTTPPTSGRGRPSIFAGITSFPPLLNTYYRFADSLGDFSLERMKANLHADQLALDGRARFGSFSASTRRCSIRRSPGRRPSALGRSSGRPFSRRPDLAREGIRAHHRHPCAVRKTAPSLTLTIVGTWDQQVRGLLQPQLRCTCRRTGAAGSHSVATSRAKSWPRSWRLTATASTACARSTSAWRRRRWRRPACSCGFPPAAARPRSSAMSRRCSSRATPRRSIGLPECCRDRREQAALARLSRAAADVSAPTASLPKPGRSSTRFKE